MSGKARAVGWAALVYFGLAVVYFFPAFAPGKILYGSDYLAGGYFFQEFVSARFAAGALPKWVPYLYGGLPLFANPGSAFHPFRFLADLFFSAAYILPAIFVLQFALAGLGMYLLARELGVRAWAAGVAGLAFEMSGLAMSFVHAGQDGRIIVATSAPLFFFFLHRGVRTGGVGAFVGAAATAAFTLLSFQIQSNYYMLLGGALWALFCLWHLGYFRRPRAFTARLALGLGAVAFAFATASVNFLPFLDYVDQSPRGGSGKGYEYATSWAMPPVETIGLAVPEQAGILENYRGENPIKLHTEYVGALVVGLLFLGVFYSRRNRYWWFFLGLTFVALSISFGAHTPIYHLYYDFLPGTKKFRSPSISFFLVVLSLVAMAALTLEELARRREERETRRGRTAAAGADPLRWVPWILGALLGLAVLGAGLNGAGPGAPAAAAARQLGYLRFGFFLALTGAGLWLWIAGRLSARWVAVGLALVTVIDLWVIDRKFFETIEGPARLFAADDVVDFLRSQPGPFRVWALPFPPGQTYARAGTDYLMGFGIDQAGGEHSDPIQRYLEVVGAGSRSMTDWHNFLQDPVFMDAANVKYLLTGVELQGPEFREVHRSPYGIVYEKVTALPRAYLVPAVQVATPPDGALAAMRRSGFDPRREAVLYAPPPRPLPGGPLTGSATVSQYTPDRVVVETSSDRGALLVLADNYYDGWHAEVDGTSAPILQTDHAFRGVEVAAGRHTVVFRFEPADLALGFRIYVVCLALLGGFGLFALVRAWRRRSAAVAG